jgi:hypothetical protein
MKKSIKKLLIYFRYILYRYFIKNNFKSFYTFKNIQTKKVSNISLSFFGYYNISPENNQKEILFLKVDSEKERSSIDESAEIYLKHADESFSEISQSKTWNWQQGCMLQWFPQNDNLIIFNDYDDKTSQYISKVIDKNGNLIRKYNIPINNVSKNGKFALSLNYDRLAIIRPDYGYFKHLNYSLPNDNDDGIWYLDMETGDIKLIITLEQLKNFYPTITMKGAKHKVNHIDISPNGERFMFLHRWIGAQGRFMRLITAKIDGTELYILNGDKMTSHSCWWGNDKIISFCYTSEFGNAYTVFTDKTSKRQLLSSKLPTHDGHPSVSPTGKWLITDSYPGLDRMSFLYLYNMENDNLIVLGRFFQPLRYQGEMRIDLHPKWNQTGNKIYFESGHQGKRYLYVINLPINIL